MIDATFVKEKKTIHHYLWQCEHTQVFWKDFEDCLRTKCTNCNRLALNANQVLFGTDDRSVLDEGFQFILLHAKFFVYTWRIGYIIPTLPLFLRKLSNIRKVDRYVHSLDMKYDVYFEMATIQRNTRINLK